MMQMTAKRGRSDGGNNSIVENVCKNMKDLMNTANINK